MKCKTALGLFALTFLLLPACTTDELPEPAPTDCTGADPTYDVEIRPIIEASCAYSGCHLGDAPGIYTSYENLLPVLQSGLFRERVINVRADPTNGMPPNYAPTDRPQDLSEEEVTLIDCWLQAGFPR